MVEVQEMQIGVTDMSEPDARRLGSAIAEKLLAKLPAGQLADRRIDEVNIRVDYQPGMGVAQLAENISSQLLIQLLTA